MNNPRKIPKRARDLLIRASACDLPDEAIVWISEALVTGVVPSHDTSPYLHTTWVYPTNLRAEAVHRIIHCMHRLSYLARSRYKHPWKTSQATRLLRSFDLSLNMYERQAPTP